LKLLGKPKVRAKSKYDLGLAEFCLRRFYTEGSWVKRGTPLFKIDPAPYEAALNKLTGTLAQEEAQLDKAKRDEARLKPLFAENAVSRKDYEDAVSARETATARVQSARAGVTEAQLNRLHKRSGADQRCYQPRREIRGQPGSGRHGLADQNVASRPDLCQLQLL
jgi:multidrug efflux pump subunit AcrA (membrane-fusion protein)